ncbi:MAG: DUF4781 domain-containing protein [Inquilinus sp.]|uniref:DUF4781 domain-containing protein n=1 Tax=Inquilinus sp. TaxID=1932117 RepID=UPI003F3D215D
MVFPADRSSGLPPYSPRVDRGKPDSPVRFVDVVDAVRKEGGPVSGTQGAPAQARPGDPPQPPSGLTDPAKTIADDRRRSIDDWVGGADDSFLPWNDDSHDKVAHALRGNSELGGLTQDERRYLIDRALDKWVREGETYSSPRDLARDVRGDGTLGPLVAERCAVKAAALEAEQRGKPASERNGDAVDIGGAAIVALHVEPGRKTDATQQAALRRLVEQLGPSKAAGLAEALSSPGLETEYASATLEALNAGPFTDSGWAFTTSAFSTTQEQRYGQGTDLSMPMAKALARGLFPQDPQRQQQEAQRIGALLSTPVGRSLLTPPNAVLGEDKVGPERRAQALAVVLQNPEITVARLSRDGFDSWASPLIAVPIAQDSADRALAASRQTPEAAADRLGGGSGVGIPEELHGAQLDNRVGQAMNLPPEGISADTPPDKLKQLKDEAARGERSFYTTGDNAGTVGKITATIRDLGGDTARVTVLPIQYSSRQTGPVQLPLFRVEGKDGKTWFVDNLGARYDSFGKWTDKNQLPPGNVTYPKGGELKPGPDGKVALESRNTPKTPDTIGEQLLEAGDMVALVGGLLAGGAMMIGSGGTAAPVVMIAAGAWVSGRGAQTLAERDDIGLSNDFGDPQARAAYFNIAAGVLSGLPLGRAAFLARTGQDVTMPGAWAVANGTAIGADTAAAGNSGYTLVKDWNDLDPAQRFEMGLGMAFWTVSAGVMARQAFQPRTGAPADPPASTSRPDGETTPPDPSASAPRPEGEAPPATPPREAPPGGRNPSRTLDLRPGEDLSSPRTQKMAFPRVDTDRVWVGGRLPVDDGSVGRARLRSLDALLRDKNIKSVNVAHFAAADDAGHVVDAQGNRFTVPEVFTKSLVGREYEDHPIVLNIARPSAEANAFAQRVADYSGVDVYVTGSRDRNWWNVFQRKTTPQGPSGRIEVENGRTFSVDDQGRRRAIDPETNLGEVLGTGVEKTAFAFGDDHVIVVYKDLEPEVPRPGEAYSDPEHQQATLAELDRLGFPIARIQAEFDFNGQKAFLQDRYVANDRDLDSRMDASGQPLSVTLLNQNSISSLKAIRSLLISEDVAIADLQFLIDKDGRFVIADPVGMKQGLDESGRSQQASNLREIDDLIDTAEVNLEQPPN